LKNIPPEDPDYKTIQEALDEISNALSFAKTNTPVTPSPNDSTSKKSAKKSGTRSFFNPFKKDKEGEKQ
jgi:hypothetical protein